MKKIIVFALLLTNLWASPVSKAPFILVKDVYSGAVFYAKDAQQRIFPSSMTKMMTAYLVFERLKTKQLSLDDKLIISEKAWRTEGSSMFLNVGQSVSVRDLLLGILVASGNDASIALAEGLAGSEEAFAIEMNKKAKELGCKDTNFANSSGLPIENHYTTAEDLYTIALRTIQDFPEFYREFYAVPQFQFNIQHPQPNLNPLIGKGLGVDGLKTGHTDAAGYGITISAEQKGMRVVIVLNGLASKKERAEESQNLVNWVFARYRTVKIAEKDKPFDKAPVWLGAKADVELTTNEDIYYSVAKSDIPNVKATIHMAEPVAAPIVKGQKLGELVLTGSDVQAELRVPLFAAESVDKIAFWGRIKAAFNHLLFGQSKAA